MDLVLNGMEELNEQELMMVDGGIGELAKEIGKAILVDLVKAAGTSAWNKAKETNSRDYSKEAKNYNHPYRGKI